MAKDTFYFSHDYNSRNDIKVKKLILKHGFLGYGIFWAIIEDLYNNANALPLDYECIAYDLRSDSETIKSILNDFDLFEINNGFFGSLSVKRRLDERLEKSEKARKSALNRWKSKEENANALRTQYECNAIKESKGKEIKEKEIEENIYKFNFKKSLSEIGADEKLISEWMAVRKTKKATNTETAFNLFKNEVEKSGNNVNEVLKKCIENSWSGFKSEWFKNSEKKVAPIRMF